MFRGYSYVFKIVKCVVIGSEVGGDIMRDKGGGPSRPIPLKYAFEAFKYF